MIETTDDIYYEVEQSDKFANKKWIDHDSLLLDLKSMLECIDYDDLHQAISDLINELEENKIRKISDTVSMKEKEVKTNG